MPENIPQRVLIVRLGAIGDVVNALVLASALREARPELHLGWAVHELALPLVQGHPALSRVHLWRRFDGARGFARALREIRAERYELAIDLQRIAKSALLARLSGATRVVGFDRARCKEQSWRLLRERIPVARAGAGAHRVDWFLEFARYLGVAEARARHELPPDSGAEARAAELMARAGAPPVLLCIGASKPANRWPAARFGELAARLARELGQPVLLVGGPRDRELAAEALAALRGLPGVHDLVGDTSLPELAALMRRARLVVSADTGPMHLAAAAGARVLALFGAADPARTGPWPVGGGRHHVLRELPHCAPCGRRTCNQPRHACMEDLSVERVLAEARAMLAQTGTPAAGARNVGGEPA